MRKCYIFIVILAGICMSNMQGIASEGGVGDDDLFQNGLFAEVSHEPVLSLSDDAAKRVENAVFKMLDSAQGIKVSAFKVSPDDTFVLSGESLYMSSVFDLIKAFEDSMLFEHVKVQETRAEKERTIYIAVFEMHGKVAASDFKDKVEESEVVDLKKQFEKNHFFDSQNDVDSILKEAEKLAALSLPKEDLFSDEQIQANNKAIELYNKAKRILTFRGKDTSRIDAEKERTLVVPLHKWEEDQDKKREKEFENRIVEGQQKYSLDERLKQEVALRASDINISDVLKFLVIKSSLNIQLPDSLSGAVSINVTHKPIKEVIDDIVKKHGLDYTISNNVISLTFK